MDDQLKIQITGVLDQAKTTTQIDSGLKQIQSKIKNVKVDAQLNNTQFKKSIDEMLNYYVKLEQISKKQLHSGTWSKTTMKEQSDMLNKTSDAQKKMSGYYSNLEKQSDSFSKKNLNGIDMEIKKRQIAAQQFSNQLKAQMQSRVNNEQNEKKLQSEYINSQQAKIKEIENRAKVESKAQNLQLDQTKMRSSMAAFAEINKKAMLDPTFKQRYDDIFKSINTNVPQAQKQFQTLKNDIVAAGKNGNMAFQDLGKNISKFASWFLIGGVVAGITRTIRDQIQVVKDLDHALTTINMTMPITKNQMVELTNSSFAMAKNLGTSVKEVLAVAQIYANMNETVDGILEKTRPTILLSTASGSGASESADSIQAVMQQFELAENQGMRIANVYEKVSANMKMEFQRGINGVSDAVKASGSVAKEAGFEFEQYASIIGKVMEKTRIEGSNIGQGMKMIFSRMGRATDGEIDEETVSKTEKAYQSIGVQLRDDKGEFREIPKVLDDLSAKWDTLNSVQRTYIAEQSAGVRQKNIFLSMMKSYKEATELTTKAINSQGFAEEVNSKRMESYDAKLKTFGANLNAITIGMVNNGLVKGFIDLLNGVTGAFDGWLIKIPLIILALTGLKTLFVSLSTVNFFATWGASLGNISAWLAIIATETGGLTFAMNALKVAILSNPLFWVAGAGLAIFGIVKLFDAFNVTIAEAQEILEKSTQEYETAKQKTKELEEELAKVSARMDELKDKKLTPIEENELNNLKATTEEMKLQLEIQRELEKTKLIEKSDNAFKSINAKTGGSTRAEYIQDNKKYFDNTEQEINRVKNDTGFTDEQKVKEINYLREHQAKLKKESIEMIKSLSEEAKQLDPEKYKELREQINQLSSSTLEWAKATDLSTNSQNKNKSTTEQVLSAQDKLKAQFEDGNMSLAEYTAKTKDLNSATEKYTTEIYNLGVAGDYLKGIQKNVAEGKSLDKDEVTKLLQLYPQLKNSIIQTADGWTIEKSALDLVTQGVGTLQSAYITAQNSMSSILSSAAAIRMGITLQELDAIQSVADAYNLLGSKASSYGMTENEMIRRGASGGNKELSDLYTNITSLGGARQKIQDLIKNIGKPNYSALAPKDKKSSSSSPADQSPDLLKLDIDRYIDLNTAVNEVKNSIDNLKLSYEDLDETNDKNGKLRIDNLNQQIAKNKELAQAYNNLTWEQKNERSELRKTMEAQGFNFTGGFDTTNSSTNYATQLESMYKTFNGMSNKTNADKDARADYKQTIDDVESAYKRIIDLNNTVYSTDKDRITALKQITKDEKAIVEIKTKFYSEIQSIIDKETSATTKSLSKRTEYYDYLISKQQALVDGEQKFYDTQNNLRQAQADIKKELAQTLALGEYSDSTLFNVDDYNALSNKLTELQEETADINIWYNNQINSLTEDNKYLEESITKEYERRLKSKEQEYEISKKELDLTKKQQELNNVLNEKTVQLMSGTEWISIADQEKVANVKGEMLSLEDEIANIRLKGEQQASIDSKQANVDNLNAEKLAVENRIKVINEQAEKFKNSIDKIINPTNTIGEVMKNLADNGVTKFDKAIGDMLVVLSKVTGKDYGYSGKVKSSGGVFYSDSVDYSALMAKEEKGSNTWNNLNNARNAKIEGEKLPYDKYASGTKSAKKGWNLLDEKGLGSEAFMTADGVFANFEGGEPVFSANMTDNLWDWGNLNPSDILPNLIKTPNIQVPNIQTKGGDTNYTINGGIKLENVTDLNNFLDQITTVFKKPAYR
jgi:TP901 family phage tail tape measure protein